MDHNPNDPNPDDFNFDNADSRDTNENANPGDTSSSKKNSNLAITIVVVAGLILGAILLANAWSSGSAPPVTPTTVAPSERLTSVPVTIPPALTATAAVTAPPQTADPIQGITWQWVSLTDPSTGQVSAVPDPQQYTIVFSPDGFVNGTADCNSYTGTYSQSNGLVITVTTMTMAACPEGSLEQQYLQLLGSVAAGGPDGSGNLALETAGGAQRMLFQNGGPTQ